MTEQQERAFPLPQGPASIEATGLSADREPEVAQHEPGPGAPSEAVPGQETSVPVGDASAAALGAAARQRHAEAGRKGAQRVHQLIQEGKLYEQEHGLKSGRQWLRQLLEQGKLYEQEHGLRPARHKRRQRLGRTEREELLATLLQCLLRIVKPSFRAELIRLVEALQEEKKGHAA